MNGIFSLKALNSETSLTSSQALELEPYLCTDTDCVFPYGPACPSCSEAQRMKEEHRQHIVEAKIIWVDENTLHAPTGWNSAQKKQVKKDVARERWFEEGGSYRSELASQSSMETIRDLSNSQAGTEKKASGTLRPDAPTAKTLLSFRDHIAKRLVRKKKTVEHLLQPMSATPPPQHQVEVSDIHSDELEVLTRSSDSDSSAATVVPIRPHHKVVETSSESSRCSSDLSSITTGIQNARLDDWLSSLPTSDSMADPHRPLSQLNNIEYLDTSNETAQVVHRGTPSLVNVVKRQPQPLRALSRTSSPSRTTLLCPLCSNPLGDIRDQHLAKCSFAHAEKAKLESMQQRL